MHKPTEAQLDILRHMLGINDLGGPVTPWRNYYAAPEGDEAAELLELLAAGLVAFAGNRFGSAIYVATAEGERLAVESARARRPSRAKRRYLAWLEVTNICHDLTFRAFLTDPQWAEVRDGNF